MAVDIILKAALYVVVGLLLLDLAPIHEGMTCDDIHNSTTCPDAYFSQSFFMARKRFVDAAVAAGARVERHVVHTDPETGLEYPMDTAFIEGAGTAAQDLIVHVSGVHGAEGFVGSAIQTKLLRTSDFWNTDARPSVLFVHAVNPYGFAELRRFNENNVDLNRNCLTTEEEWKEVRERNSNIVGYEDFRALLVPEGAPSLLSRYSMLFNGIYNMALHGYTKMKATLVTGQYHDPRGVYYGGNELQPSLKILQKILAPFASKRHIFAIDVHSGLGSPGEDSLLVESEEAASKIREVLPESALQPPGAGAHSGYELTRGHIDYSKLLNREALGVVQEFGTIAGIFVARACILENQAYHHARGTFIHTVTKHWLRDAFYPQEIATKQKMLKRGVSLFNMSWTHFAHQ